MHRHSVNYLERDRGRRDGQLFNRGFWLNGTPRLIPICRLLGHRPVVDGTDPIQVRPDYRGPGNQWVCCDRCGIRPNPQGSLDPDQWDIGQAYTGPWGPELPDNRRARTEAVRAFKDTHFPPGPWPTNPTGTIGGQLILGKAFSTTAEIKIGNPGSEHVLAAHLSIAPLGALHLHTERHGQVIQRRLNPHTYHSRVTGFSIHGGHCYWRIWANRDQSSVDDPWWQHGSFRTNLVDLVLGPKSHTYEDIGDPVTTALHLPHGDEHQVVLRLRRGTLTRPRRRRLLEQTWSVEISTRPGIPTKTGGHGRVLGFSVPINDVERHGDWIAAGLAQAAVHVTRSRARTGYTLAPVSQTAAAGEAP